MIKLSNKNHKIILSDTYLDNVPPKQRREVWELINAAQIIDLH